MRRRDLEAVTLALAVAGCAAPRLSLRAVAEPRSLPTAVPARVALVLSGGAVRGFAHIGVLRVLERESLVPDLIVGTSAGAIVGTMWAAGVDSAGIERLASRLDLSLLLDVDPWRMVIEGIGLGVARGERLERFLRDALPVPMEQFPRRFAAVATDLEAGAPAVLTHGDAALALRASSAVPGLYEPVQAGGRLLADGQLVSPLPVNAARSLGARRVIAIDVVWPPREAKPGNPVSVLLQGIAASTWHHLQRERRQADLVIAPAIPATRGQLSLADGARLIAIGERAALERRDVLKALFAGREVDVPAREVPIDGPA